ncbi:MAG TPA: hypothetical protein VMY42_06500 [Thermoguttaceae bacterium]|nr:hypothetical protein [Thermoguttaceae bacterium]
MATVLVAWELGGGLGHLVPLLPLVRGLCERGHRVFAALKDLPRAGAVFDDAGVSFLQAPLRTGRVRNHIERPRTFAHILHNVGFSDSGELRTLAEAWRHLFDYVQPDLILFDHSPTALLAARTHHARRAVIGIPFACPPDAHPFPDLRPGLGDPCDLRRDEDLVLDRVNKVLASWHQPQLTRLSQLYHPVDETFLTTFQELDHYPTRKGSQYWGVWPLAGGQPPSWPKGKGKRLFAYLKSFPALPRLLALLNELRCPTLVYSEENDPRLRKRFQSATLRFANQRVDPSLVCAQCDLAILNGGHGTTASMLMAGKPILQLPIYLEQKLNAAATIRLGAGLSARIGRPEEIAVKLMALLCSEKHTEAARRFARRYADFDPKGQLGKALRRTEELVCRDVGTARESSVNTVVAASARIAAS